MRQNLRKIAYAPPLFAHPVIDLAGIIVGLLRLDHSHPRHGDLLPPAI
jgi:hypothetical protein